MHVTGLEGGLGATRRAGHPSGLLGTFVRRRYRMTYVTDVDRFSQINGPSIPAAAHM